MENYSERPLRVGEWLLIAFFIIVASMAISTCNSPNPALNTDHDVLIIYK